MFGERLERQLVSFAELARTRCLPVSPDKLDEAIWSVERKRRDADNEREHRKDDQPNDPEGRGSFEPAPDALVPA